MAGNRKGHQAPVALDRTVEAAFPLEEDKGPNMSETYRTGWEKPLDPSLYAPDDEEKAFMKEATGIEDDEKLKAHIIAVQSKAFAVCEVLSMTRQTVIPYKRGQQLYKYPCIRQFDFMRSVFVDRL